MRRSVAAPETGVGARVAALAVAPAVLDAPGDTAVLVARAGVSGGYRRRRRGPAVGGHGDGGDRGGAGAAMTGVPSVTGTAAGTTGRARTVTGDPAATA